MTGSNSTPDEPERQPTQPPPRPTSGQAPRWGEYAPIAGAPAGPEDAARRPAEPRAPAPVPPAPTSAGSGDVGARKPRTWDRILTIALLAIATYNVLSGFFAYSNLADTLGQVYAMQGIGEFTSFELADTIGSVLNVLQVSVFVVVAVLSYRMLRQSRITFWVPLAGGVLVSMVSAVLIIVLLASDPAFQDYLRTLE